MQLTVAQWPASCSKRVWTHAPLWQVSPEAHETQPAPLTPHWVSEVPRRHTPEESQQP
jgi:hypothetical protein